MPITNMENSRTNSGTQTSYNIQQATYGITNVANSRFFRDPTEFYPWQFAQAVIGKKIGELREILDDVAYNQVSSVIPRPNE